MGYLIDGTNKVITLTAGTISVSVRDLWSRWVDWYLTSDNSKYLPAFENVGGNEISAIDGTYIPIYAFLVNDWRIKPQESNHTLSIKDGILLVNGGGDPFNNTNGAYVVRINYQQPVQAISFSTSGSTNPAPTVQEIRQEIDTNSIKLDELHKLQGLNKDNPMTITPEIRTVGDIELKIEGNGETLSIISRQ